MWYTIIRLLFFGIAFLICFVIIKKSKTENARKYMTISFICMMALCTASTFIPAENAFITFPSPGAAYIYSNPGSAKLIVEGENSDFVIGEKDDTYINSIIPKTDDGWKIGTSNSQKIVLHTYVSGAVVYIYRYKNTDDYYITVMGGNPGTLQISDNQNSDFKCLEKSNKIIMETYYIYCAHIKDFDSSYTLTVNGNEIKAEML